MKMEIQKKAGIAILISEKIDLKINPVISSQVALAVKNLPADARDTGDNRFDPRVGKIPWRAWQSTPVFLPGESHGQRSLAGCSVRL